MMRGYSEFAQWARQTVANYWNKHVDVTDRIVITAEDVFITWYAKELQNQKAMLAITQPDGMYFELTWDGDKERGYLDVYKKWENKIVFPIKEG